MKRKRQHAFAFAAAFAAAVCVSSLGGQGSMATALATPPAPFDWGARDWEGGAELIDLARSELGNGRIVVTDRLDLHALTPADGVLILHPTLSLDVESYARFLHAGGRIVLLDDYGTGDALLAHFGMERVPMPPNPTETLRGNPSFAIAEPASAHAVVSDVNRVVTNHATGIRHPELTPLLEVHTETGGSVLLAVAGQVATNGRFLAVGDPSIVMNSMLRYAGNKTFARNLLHYAAGDEAGEHGHGRLYMVEGGFEQSGAFGDQPSWLDERARALKDGLSSIRAEGVPSGMAYALAVLVGLGIIWWTGSRAGRTHRATRPKFTRATPIEAQGGVAGHAAVIGGDRAPRLLAMLELKSALEERLCAVLDIDENPGHEEILAMLAARKWLRPDVLAHLRALLLRMANVETMMLSQRAGATMTPVRDREVIAASNDVDRIVDAVGESARASGATRRDS